MTSGGTAWKHVCKRLGKAIGGSKAFVRTGVNGETGAAVMKYFMRKGSRWMEFTEKSGYWEKLVRIDTAKSFLCMLKNYEAKAGQKRPAKVVLQVEEETGEKQVLNHV